MKRISVLAPIILLIFFTLFSSACGTGSEEAAAPPEDVVPTKSETLKELEAMEPTFVIRFDGKECVVEGPNEVKFGKYLFVHHNLTDLPSTQALGSYFGEGSYDNHFQWREENCGGPESDHFQCEENCGGQGAYCRDVDGDYISYSFATWYNPIKQANDGGKTLYKLFEIDMEREYVIWAYADGRWGWLCDSFQVTK
jgi:hypothetical protein